MLSINDVNDKLSLHNDVLFFPMENCPACDEIQEMLVEFKEEFTNLNFYKVDFDINNDKFKALTSKLNVTYYPSVVLVRNDLPVFSIEAFYAESSALDAAQRVLSIGYRRLNGKKWVIREKSRVKNYLSVVLNDFNMGVDNG